MSYEAHINISEPYSIDIAFRYEHFSCCSNLDAFSRKYFVIDTILFHASALSKYCHPGVVAVPSLSPLPPLSNDGQRMKTERDRQTCSSLSFISLNFRSGCKTDIHALTTVEPHP